LFNKFYRHDKARVDKAKVDVYDVVQKLKSKNFCPPFTLQLSKYNVFSNEQAFFKKIKKTIFNSATQIHYKPCQSTFGNGKPSSPNAKINLTKLAESPPKTPCKNAPKSNAAANERRSFSRALAVDAVA